ncbi:hypothetical protein CMI37_01480, partial [Candidatus Pacearchaeota archaeon]|nr:hypothetical protein [Candidatus Pacearchaeota archaeon]
MSLCTLCGDSGVYIQEDAYMTCPFCKGRKQLIADIETIVAEFIINGEHEEAKEMNIIYNLLKTSPVLAVLEAEHQNRNIQFIDKI